MAEAAVQKNIQSELSDTVSDSVSVTVTDSDSSSNLDGVHLSLEGMKYLLTNDWDKALDLFGKYKDDNPLMCAGYSWFTVMKSLMTFEEEHLKNAMKVLHETEKKCSSKDGFHKSSGKKSKASKRIVSIEEKLQKQIIIADCVIHQAILTFLNQDIPSYIKGGWLLRKAYKNYEKLYKQISKMYTDSLENKGIGVSATVAEFSFGFQNDENDVKSVSSDVSDISAEYHVTGSKEQVTFTSANEIEELAQEAESVLELADNSKKNANSKESSSSKESQSSVLSHEVIERLLGSVSVGYGAFQLMISLIPPKILKIIEFLGFDGDREVGLKALQFASQTKDMKAPLASLGVIWYHTVIRPFFALDGNSVDAGVEDALIVIERCEKLYPNSSLFLFFKARAQRLQCKLGEALDTYRTALTSCQGQREMELICFHEIGWLEMMKLNYEGCCTCFSRLKQDSRWSKSYYSYLFGICSGALGKLDQAKELFKDVSVLMRNKNNEVEKFAAKRAEKFLKKIQLSGQNCQLYLLEVVYLWNALTQCPQEDIDNMIQLCNSFCDKDLFHLKCLIEGALYRQKGDEIMSMQCFEEAIARADGKKDDQHVAAYATYEIGITKAAKPETYEEGKSLLHKARDGFKEYDFDNRLSVRVNAALRRLKDEGTPI